MRKPDTKTQSKAQLGVGKGWFCTWPQCDIPKEYALKLLEPLGLEEFIIAEEKHKDGSPHLHAFLKLKKKKRVKVDTFDLDGYHGHYEVARSWKAVKEYCVKDENYISNINVKAAMRKQAKKLDMNDFNEDPIKLLQDGRLHPLSLNNFLRNRESYRALLSKTSQNRKDASPLKKKRHEWLCGPSNTGKTTILRQEIADCPDNWFQIPYNNDWNGYYNQEHLYADEYKGQLKINDLNRICDGGAKMNTKGGTVQLANDVVVHIVSNYSIEECYNEVKDDIRETLYNRFIENRLTKKYN